jgi:hypothetical protein
VSTVRVIAKWGRLRDGGIAFSEPFASARRTRSIEWIRDYATRNEAEVETEMTDKFTAPDCSCTRHPPMRHAQRRQSPSRTARAADDGNSSTPTAE